MASRHTAPTKQQEKNYDDGNGMSIIVPSAGFSRKFKYTGPKCLFKINNVPILEYQLNVINNVYPKAEIFVIVGFDASKIKNKIKRKNVRYIYNGAFDSSNVLYSIGLGLFANTNSRVLIIYGDLIFNENTIRGFTSNGSSILVDSKNYLKDREVGITQHDLIVENLTFEVKPKWGQMAYLINRELDIFEKCATHNECMNWYGHEGLNYVISNGGILKTFEPKNYKLLEIDNHEDIAKIKNFLKES